jgi:hypothetical protein
VECAREDHGGASVKRVGCEFVVDELSAETLYVCFSLAKRASSGGLGDGFVGVVRFQIGLH